VATCPKCRTRYDDEQTECSRDGSTLVPDHTFANTDREVTPGEMIGDYRVEKKIGEGGFGAVYSALQPVIGKPVAIKLLNRQFSSNPEMVSRFIAEARAANQIRNKNIIDIFGFGALPDGRQYYVMELLEGMTLDRYLAERGRLLPTEAIPLLRGVARALDAAHAAGIAHRDLKPENIFLEVDEDRGVSPKLLDFGIAKLLGDSSAEHRTRTGAPIGTPHYMSPEQCRGLKIDHRTDIYSFGVVAFQLLTGKLPFSGDSYMDVMLQHASSAPPMLSSLCPDLPGALDSPIAAMLAKPPEQRPGSAGLALEALAEAARDAGLGVEVRPVRAAASLTTPPPGRTPLELDQLASAETIQAPASRTLENAATAGSAAGKRRAPALWIGAALLGAAALALLLLRPSAGAPETPVATEPVATAAAPPQASSESEAVALPVPEEKSPETITLELKTQPKQVEVFLGGDRLGTSLEPIALPFGEQSLELELRARGFKSGKLTVVPDQNRTLESTLAPERAAPAKKAGGAPKDLEF
jgi:eukaryotic-like serine/threonine-protein kinase